MTEQQTAEVFRLSWESISPHTAAEIEAEFGKSIWPTVQFDALEGWRETSVEFVGDERMGQYRTLKRWAETHEQPIRNVRLERGVAAAVDWQPVEDVD